MQDYFNGNKLQQGSSLFMKSDSDGVKDGQNRAMPLGIKSAAEGIQHFTNWENIANSIESKSFARFDDVQPTSLSFSTMEQKPKAGGIYFDDFIHGSTDIAEGRRTVEFTDTWTPNDIKILDDIAFVAQEEYTDVHRKDIPLLQNGVSVEQLIQNINIEVTTPGAGGSVPAGDTDDGMGVSSWTISGTWSANFEGSSPTGSITLTYTPSTSTWSFSATVPNDGGWGGNITGTKVQDACSCTGGGCANTTVSIPVSGTHYCSFSGGSSSYSGIFNLAYTPSSSSGKNCSDDISSIGSYTLNYLAGGGCSLGFSASGTTYNGYVPSGGGGGDIDPGPDTMITRISRIGTLGFRTDSLDKTNEKVYSFDSFQLDPPKKHTFTSDFDSYSNSILKIGFTQQVNGQIVNQQLPKVAYFIFGGVVKDDTGLYVNSGDIPYNNLDRANNPLPRSILSNCASKKFRDWKQSGFSVMTPQNPKLVDTFSANQKDLTDLDDLVVGYFYVVVKDSTEQLDDGRLINTGDTVGIQLSVQSNWGQSPEFEGNFDDLSAFVSNGLKNYIAAHKMTECTLMKFQPVRKCGKVDIYTRKTGIISAVVNNSITSSNHNLNNNDIIKISSAIFDGAQNGIADIHPLNGNKFVKKIDDDTFEVYDDQYFKDATSTENLKTTEGIVWTCVSNNFGSLGQSWDYYGSMFSPTGRNGYSHPDPSSSLGNANFLAAKDSFFTTKRIKSGVSENTPATDRKSIELPFGELGLYFSDLGFSAGPIGYWMNTKFAKELEENIPVVFSDVYSTPLDDPRRGPQDFFPYHCQDDLSNFVDPNPALEGSDIKSPYPGMRFGSSMDLKFSHYSGNSRVYTLAVGERGSDVSVDLFGVVPSEQLFEKPNMEWSDEQQELYQTFRKKITPYYLPYGRTHLISITLDQYGRISDLSHEDTVFGGGGSISKSDVRRDTIDSSDLAGIEYNPWLDFEWTSRYNYRARSPGLTTGLGANIISFGDTFSSISSFNERVTDNQKIDTSTNPNVRRNSRYWLRSAVMHWKGQNIYDRYSRQDLDTGEFREVLKRNIKSDRRCKLTDSLGNRSRFGIGENIETIDRFGSPEDDLYGEGVQYWAIFPWVDSFGKAVSIHNSSSLSLGSLSPSLYPESNPKTVILSASRVRSNIDISNSLEQPVLAKDANLSDAETVSQIGQITAHFLYKNSSNVYKNVDYIPFNSAGSVGGRFSSGEKILTTNGISYSSLGTGTAGGKGMSEVISAAELSCSKILWKDDYIVWSEQDISNGNSIVHFFTFSGKFNPAKTISKAFKNPRREKYTGEGFGLDFKYEDRLFLTNSLDNEDEGGDLIATLGGIDGHFIDQIFVYEIFRNKSSFDFSQKILTAIDESREDYYSEYFKSADYLMPDMIPIKNAFNYDNNSLHTSAWDIDLSNRYDLAGKKIVVKDAIEYSLFDRDYSQSEAFSISDNYEDRVPIYLGISEDASIQRLKSSTTINYNYIPQSTTEYDCASSGGEISTYRTNKTPFFFLKLPLDSLDMVNDITINFDILQEDLFSSFNTLNQNEETNNIVPRIVLYGKDPRSTIIENGPATRGSSSSIYPRYENGLWSRPRWDAGPHSEYYSDMYPGYYRGGAQDLFFYGRLPGSLIKTGKVDFPERATLPYLYGGNINLGEYYDLTAGSRGGGDAGDPAWIAPDVYQHFTPNEIAHILPYAKIFSPTLNPDGYSVNISAQDVRDFVIDGSLVKDVNRPTSVAGNFNDSSNLYSGASDINYTLAIGFVLTNVNSFDITTAETLHQEPSLNLQTGPIRHIGVTDSTNSNFPNARYAYTPDVNFYEFTLNGAEVVREGLGLSQLEYELRAKVRNLDVSISKKRLLSRRYRNSFHKIAVFNYNKAERDEVRKFYIDSADAKVYSDFGFSNLVPVPESIRRPYSEAEGRKTSLVKSNPIVAISRSSASSDSDLVKDGSFSSSLQILNTDSIYYSDARGTSSNIYLNEDTGFLEYVTPPTGYVIGKSEFATNTLLGGFDIQSPEYLSLFMNTNPTETNAITLTANSHEISNSGGVLVTAGLTSRTSVSPLWIGVNEFNFESPLFLRALIGRNNAPLFTFEVAPSAISPLFTDAPDASGGVSLVVAPPVTKTASLYTIGPIQATGITPLNIQSHALDSKASPLSISGVFFSTGLFPLYTEASVPDSGFIGLAMNPIYSGATPLFIVKHLESSGKMPLTFNAKASGVQGISLFTGNQFDLINNDVDLFIKPQEFASGQTPLRTKGEINTANSNRNGVTSVSPTVSDQLFDKGGIFGQGRESAIIKNLSGKIYQSNSVVANVVNEDIYSRNRMDYDSADRSKLWFMSSSLRSSFISEGVEYKDPAFTLSKLGSNSLVKAFYENNNKESDIETPNYTIKQEAYDVNDDYLIKTSIAGDVIELSFYDLDDDGNVSQIGERNHGGIIRMAPSRSSLDSQQLSLGVLDPFYSIREDIYNKVKTIHGKSFEKSQILNTGKVSVNDVKISSNNKCAVSLRVRVEYSKDFETSASTFNVIIVFNINNYKGVSQGFNSASDYGWIILEESGEDAEKENSGYSLAFDNQDVYFDRRGVSSGSLGEVYRLLSEGGYKNYESVVKFSQLSDASYYNSNAAYIQSSERRVGFATSIKIFDEYETSNKIMLINAPLLDPYVFNTLTDSHSPNAMGAVYIYKRSASSDSWSYHGAVYSKGFTSANIISNLGSYRGGAISASECALFGYDFDYNEGVLVVSEPGGDGSNIINSGKVYAFDISSTPSLLKTYSASSVSLPNGTTVSAGDNFGSNVVLLGKEDVISWSDATLSQDTDLGFRKYQNDSTIYNLRDNSVFGLSYENRDGVLTFSSEAVKSEINPYNADGLQLFSEDNIYRWSRIASIKKLKAKSRDRLLVVREFFLKLNSGSSSDVANKSIRIQKLSVIDLNRSSNGTLFISGPIGINSSASLYNLANGPSGEMPLFMGAPVVSRSGDAPLFVSNLLSNQNLPLYTERVNNPYAPLRIGGVSIDSSSRVGLVLKNQEVSFSAPLITKPSAAVKNNNVSTFVEGSIGIGNSNDRTLFIGKDIYSDGSASLFVQSPVSFTPGADLGQNDVSLSVSGMFESSSFSETNLYLNAPIVGSVTSVNPLMIKTEIPFTGGFGGLIESGLVSLTLNGNNDAGVFSKFNQTALLSIKSEYIESGVSPLFIQKSFGNSANLFIDSRIASGVSDLYVDGANISNSGISLTLKTLENSNFNMFTRGFLD